MGRILFMQPLLSRDERRRYERIRFWFSRLSDVKAAANSDVTAPTVAKRVKTNRNTKQGAGDERR